MIQNTVQKPGPKLLKFIQINQIDIKEYFAFGSGMGPKATSGFIKGVFPFQISGIEPTKTQVFSYCTFQGWDPKQKWFLQGSFPIISGMEHKKYSRD